MKGHPSAATMPFSPWLSCTKLRHASLLDLVKSSQIDSMLNGDHSQRTGDDIKTKHTDIYSIKPSFSIRSSHRLNHSPAITRLGGGVDTHLDEGLVAANGSPDSGKLAVYIFFKARHPGHDGALLCRHHAPPAPSLWASSASLMHGLTQSNFNFEEFSMFYQIRDLGSIDYIAPQ